MPRRLTLFITAALASIAMPSLAQRADAPTTSAAAVAGSLQSAFGPDGAAKPPSATAVPAPADLAVVESALRYYASQKQTARVEAEIRRLKYFYPGWAVPADLYTARPGRPEEAPLWKLFATDRIDELRAAIQARIAADPHWQLSDDLAAKLRHKETRIKILRANNDQQWRAAVDIAEANAASIDLDDVELKWAIAQAYAKIHRTNKAFEVLYSILATSRDAPQRIGTAEKAIALLPMTDADKLIAMGRISADGHSEFEPIATDITRARIGAYLHDEPAQAVAPPELEQFEAIAKASDDPNQSGLVAWYRYKRRESPDALEWFKWSLGHGGDAMIAHGLAHTLRRLGMMREAEEVSYAWREPLTNNAILFIDVLERDLTNKDPPFIEPARLTRYAQVTMATESGEGAQALAWYAYNSCQFETALDWFQRAAAWLPKEATVYGYALTLQRLKHRREFFETVNRYDGLFPSVVALVFPDGLRHPPTRCDVKSPTERVVVPVATISNEVGGRHLRLMGEPPPPGEGSSPDTYGRDRAGPVRTRAPALPIVPRPLTAAGEVAVRMPVLRRDEFPIAVRPENNLRFASDPASGSREPAPPVDGLATPEPAGAIPLAARRVPGVGAMPYERYGFALLPGWNGIEEASDPASSDQPPAIGTNWADEEKGAVPNPESPPVAASPVVTNQSAAGDANRTRMP